MGTAREDASSRQLTFQGASGDRLARQPLTIASEVLTADGADISVDATELINLAGDESLLRCPAVAIIGTRDVSKEGAGRAVRLARELVEQQMVIVSGLAKGVTYALESAMASGGRVIAVIGTPLSQAYPAENAELQQYIYHEHLLISQLADGSRVFRSNFPQRNRLMAMIG